YVGCMSTTLSFFLIAAPTTQIYCLSLHDALPILPHAVRRASEATMPMPAAMFLRMRFLPVPPATGAAGVLTPLSAAVRSARPFSRWFSGPGFHDGDLPTGQGEATGGLVAGQQVLAVQIEVR